MRKASNRTHRQACLLASAGMAASLGWSVPALAQDSDVAALDQLVERSSSVNSAIELARVQAAAGDLLGAATTYERVLIADENADEARLAYAAILCRPGRSAGPVPARPTRDHRAGKGLRHRPAGLRQRSRQRSEPAHK